MPGRRNLRDRADADAELRRLELRCLIEPFGLACVPLVEGLLLGVPWFGAALAAGWLLPSVIPNVAATRVLIAGLTSAEPPDPPRLARKAAVSGIRWVIGEVILATLVFGIATNSVENALGFLLAGLPIALSGWYLMCFGVAQPKAQWIATRWPELAVLRCTRPLTTEEAGALVGTVRSRLSEAERLSSLRQLRLSAPSACVPLLDACLAESGALCESALEICLEVEHRPAMSVLGKLVRDLPGRSVPLLAELLGTCGVQAESTLLELLALYRPDSLDPAARPAPIPNEVFDALAKVGGRPAFELVSETWVRDRSKDKDLFDGCLAKMRASCHGMVSLAESMGGLSVTNQTGALSLNGKV